MKKNKKNNNNNKINLQQERAEKLAIIGTQLKQVREEKALSLYDIATITMIRPSQLYAIEEGKIDYLPEPVYIQGFIRKFADALGLNGRELSQEFPVDKFQFNMSPVWLYLPIVQVRPLHLYLVYIMIILWSVNNLSSTMRQAETQAKALDWEKDTEVQTNSQDSKVLKKLPEKSGQIKNAVFSVNKNTKDGKISYPQNDGDAKKQPVRVNLTFKAESWIRIEVDGKVDFEGVLPQGTQRTWVANQKMIVKTDNPGNVLFAVNNQPAKQLGKDDSGTEEVIFTANNRS